MLKQEIRLSVLSIDEGDDTIQFQIEATNGINATSLDFYGYEDNFKEFARGLISFPKTIDDTMKYELGEPGTEPDKIKWAYHLLLRVFCYEVNGHSAIHIIVSNNGEPPHTNKSEFYILTVPASLNKLGQLLNAWDPRTTKEIIWTAER